MNGGLSSPNKKRGEVIRRVSKLRTGAGVLLLLRLLAADRLQLGEHGIDIEIVAAFLGVLHLGLLFGGLGGRQQRGAD